MAAVAWMKGGMHKYYEDRYRLLCLPVPIVLKRIAGEIYAVFDGIGSAPKDMTAAQAMCDVLVTFGPCIRNAGQKDDVAEPDAQDLSLSITWRSPAQSLQALYFKSGEPIGEATMVANTATSTEFE